MKTVSLVIATSFLIPCSIRSQDQPGSTSLQSEAALPNGPTTARILGNLPDGTPPPPVPPKPKFVVPARDVVASKTHQQGGRSITIREIKPIALPPPAEAPVPVPMDINDPALQARIAERRARHPHLDFLFLGATVFRSNDAPTRSRVHLWPPGKGEPVVFWSSADFAYLSGIGQFLGSDGETRSFLMAWSIDNSDRKQQVYVRPGKAYTPPVIPDLPAGPATFTTLSGDPDSETLVAIQSLHDLYNNEQARLQTAYEGRERARIRKEAELKANPPQPKDIVINHWRIASDQPALRKGATR